MTKKTIKVIDYMMGTGKTSYILNMLARDYATRFIYIAPLLSEVEDRASHSLVELDVIVPSASESTKSEDLLQHLKLGKNICTTHSLFTALTHEHLEYIKEWKYILVIDETVDFIESYNKYSAGDIHDLIKRKDLTVDTSSNGKVSMNWEISSDNLYMPLKKLCDISMLYGTKESNSAMLNTQIPPSMIDNADTVYLLTYMYEASFMHSFMKLHKYQHEYVEIPELEARQQDIKAKLKDNIELVSIPSADKEIAKVKSSAFSYKWWDDNKGKVASSYTKKIDNWLKNNKYRGNFFFTCPKSLVVSKNKYALLSRVNSYRELLPSITVDQGEKQLWLASNTRATNLYKDRELCLYLINVYPNVGVQHYLMDYLEPIDKDKYALSEMLQFIWRGCVRDNKPMKLYIASARMKGLFKDWLEST
jgi:hypothetical protein